jgi:hypothetical protein
MAEHGENPYFGYVPFMDAQSYTRTRFLRELLFVSLALLVYWLVH